MKIQNSGTTELRPFSLSQSTTKPWKTDFLRERLPVRNACSAMPVLDALPPHAARPLPDPYMSLTHPHRRQAHAPAPPGARPGAEAASCSTAAALRLYLTYLFTSITVCTRKHQVRETGSEPRAGGRAGGKARRGREGRSHRLRRRGGRPASYGPVQGPPPNS